GGAAPAAAAAGVMRREVQRAAVAGAAALLLLTTILGVWLVLRGPGSPRAEIVQAPIELRTAFTPLEPEFADTVTAVVDVFVDRRTIDPASVRLHERLAPYVVVGGTRRSRPVGNVAVRRFSARPRCIDKG